MQKKEIIELSITGILVVVMLFAVGNAAKKSRSRNIKDTLPKVLTSAPLPQEKDKKIDSQNLYNSLEKQAELIQLKRDPFTAAPIKVEKNIQSGIALTGIIWDKDNPLAVIDGNIVKEGARVGDKTLIEIKQDRVILSDGEAFSEVRLKQ